MSIIAKACPDLETSRLLLRKISVDDAEGLFEVFSDEKTTYYVPRERHDSRAATIDHIKILVNSMNEGKSMIWSMVDKAEGRVIGTVNLYFKPDQVASVGAVIGSKHWGKGFATEALREIIRFGFNDLGIIRMEGKCESRNIASEKVLEKLGMTYEGTLRKEVVVKGVSRDAKIYSVLIDEYRP